MNVLREYDQQAVLQDAVDEYERLLTFQNLNDLHDLADRWNVKLSSGNKASVVKQLAARFSEPHTQKAILAKLKDVGYQVLAYIHLLLAPDYGLSADSILRGLLHQRQRAVQPLRAGEPLLSLYNEQWARDSGFKQSYQEQITELAQSGLLLPFKQGNALYYTLPALVRSRLPSQPGLVPAYTGDLQALDLCETTFGVLVHNLFVVWNTLANGIPGTDGPPLRHKAPLRQPIEDQWSLLRDWDHDPSELSILTRGQYEGGRSASLRLDRVSAATFNWAMTIPAPAPQLCDHDRQHIRSQVGGTDDQIEFYYALLESLGMFSGIPGEPIVVHKETLQRFLRLSAAHKIQTLWHTWINAQMQGEIRAALRQDGQFTLRLRRSLAHQNYKPKDLHHEWHVGRAIVLRFLSLLPEGQWLSVDGLLKAIFDVHPNLLHTTSDPSVWWIESSRTGKQFGTAFEDWQQSYGQFVISMLCGPLQWLGIVRLGYLKPSQDAPKAAHPPAAFQLTETGLFALGRRSELLSEQAASSLPHESSCFVSKDLTVTVVPDRAPLDVHNLLHSTGRLLEATPDRFIYQLTAEGVSNWLASESATRTERSHPQESADALIAALSQYCHPSNTAWCEKLRTWERNRGLLHIYENIALVELADDYALQELLISTSLADSLVHRFSPRLVAIWADRIDALVEEMEKRGYTPRIQ